MSKSYVSSHRTSNILSAKSYEEIVEHDLEFMWSIKRYCRANPWIDSFMSRLVSKNPLQDICIVLWVVFIVGWIEIGHAHFWVCAMNVTVVILTRRILESKRPVEYDRRLRPRTEINPESYGFPSIETHMAVVIFGHLYLSYLSHHPTLYRQNKYSKLHGHNVQQQRFGFFSSSPFTSSLSSSSQTTVNDVTQENTNNLLAFLLSSYSISCLLLFVAMFMSLLIGFSRVYSASRFPHQVVASYVTGLVGLLLSRQCCEHLAFHKMRDFEHYSCLVFVLLGAFANLAMNLENNDSRVLYIPKQEFMRVICGILSSGGAGDAVLASDFDKSTNMEEEDDDDDDNYQGGRRNITNVTPREAALRAAQNRYAQQQMQQQQNSGNKRRYVKSDSLFFLQRSMEEREKKMKQQQQQSSSLSTEPDDYEDNDEYEEKDGGKDENKRYSKYYYGNEGFYDSSDNDEAKRSHLKFNNNNSSFIDDSFRSRFRAPNI